MGRGQGRQKLEIREILIGLEHLQYLMNTGRKKKKSSVNKQKKKNQEKEKMYIHFTDILMGPLLLP